MLDDILILINLLFTIQIEFTTSHQYTVCFCIEINRKPLVENVLLTYALFRDTYREWNILGT